jgi:hypothetical protein
MVLKRGTMREDFVVHEYICMVLHMLWLDAV